MREVTFLTLAEAVEIHNDMVGKYGGTAGVRCQRISVDGPEQPLDEFRTCVSVPEPRSPAPPFGSDWLRH
jgi:hypothetical protein